MRARTKPPQHGKVRTGRFRSCTPAARTCQSHNPRSVQLRMGTAGVRARVCGRGKREREVHEVHCLPSGPRRTIVHTPPPATNLPAHAQSPTTPTTPFTPSKHVHSSNRPILAELSCYDRQPPDASCIHPHKHSFPCTQKRAIARPYLIGHPQSARHHIEEIVD